jgi:hypothetical protein
VEVAEVVCILPSTIHCSVEAEVPGDAETHRFLEARDMILCILGILVVALGRSRELDIGGRVGDRPIRLEDLEVVTSSEATSTGLSIEEK